MKKLSLIVCTAVLFITSSCRNAPPASAKDEITSYQWTFTDLSENTHGSLSFSDGKIKISDDIIDFCEDCAIDDNCITVCSQNYGTVIINYSLDGDDLQLEYLGKKISLKKK